MIKLSSYVSYGAQALNYFFQAQAQLGLVDFSHVEPGSWAWLIFPKLKLARLNMSKNTS